MSEATTTAAPGAPALRTAKTFESCRHLLTTDQMVEAGRELADTQREVGQLEDDFKSVRDDWKARISSAEARMTTLAGRISRGYDMKNTECTVTMDSPDPGLKTCTRNDTGERVWVRDMTESDKQLALPLDDEESKTAVAGAISIIAKDVKELAEKNGLAPETLLKALEAIAKGANSVAKLQREMKVGYSAAKKLFDVAKEAGAPEPVAEENQEGTSNEY